MNDESDLYSIGFKAYMQGVVDDRASYALIIKGGTWHFNPKSCELSGQIYGFVPDGFDVKDNGNGTWTVSEITSVNVMVEQVPGMTVVVKVGEIVIPRVDGVYTVDPRSRVVATYTANEGYCGQTIVKEIVAAEAGCAITLDESEKAKPVVAKVGEATFGSVAEAATAANSLEGTPT